MDIITYAKSKTYTNETAEEFGGLKGAPCTIKSITPITGGNRVTFEWKNTEGATQEGTLDVMDGEDGLSIVSATIGADDHLILTLSDGTVLDAGEIPTAAAAEDITYTNAEYPTIGNAKQALDQALNQDAEKIRYTNADNPSLTNVKLALDSCLLNGAILSQALTVSNPLGSATSGKVYAVNTSLESVIRDILIKEEAPTLTLNISPNKTLYDVVEETVSSVTMSAVVGAKTYGLSKVEFYVNNVLKDTQTISTGGTYAYIATFSPATNSNFTLKAIVYDAKTGTPLSTTKTIQVKFVGKSYFGTIDDGAGEPTAAIIKALQNKTLKDVKKLLYSHITMDYGKVVYAYPSSFGALTKISDEKNNINYTDSFTKTTVTVDGISYFCYTQTESSASSDVELTFT